MIKPNYKIDKIKMYKLISFKSVSFGKRYVLKLFLTDLLTYLCVRLCCNKLLHELKNFDPKKLVQTVWCSNKSGQQLTKNWEHWTEKSFTKSNPAIIETIANDCDLYMHNNRIQIFCTTRIIWVKKSSLLKREIYIFLKIIFILFLFACVEAGLVTRDLRTRWTVYIEFKK